MSRFRDYQPQSQDSIFRAEDRKYIKQLLEGKKLTDKQREALRRLYASYNYTQD